MNSNKKKLVITGSLFIGLTILFIIFTLLVKLVDVQAIGPNGSSVGLATFNGYFNNLVESYSKTWNVISTLIMILSFAALVGIIVLGIVELVKKKSLFKVDSRILALGIAVVVAVVIYFVFELAKINYRPILVNDALKASYPSTHVFLTIFLFASITEYIVSSKIFSKPINITIICAASILSILVCLGRYLAKEHWMTDIIGSILLALALYFLYVFVNQIFEVKLHQEDEAE